MNTSFETQKNSTRPFAVITGASSGIGFELAKVFAKNNFDLLVAAEDSSILDAANTLLQMSVSVEPLQVNLATYEGVERLYYKIQNLGLPIHSLCVNAGVGVGGDFLNTNLEAELNMIQLNIVSGVHLCKRILPDLVAQGSGRILFTSSLAAEMPGPHYAIYAATKAFVQSFAEAIRFELKDSGVSVTALQPGATETEFFERAHMEDTVAGQSKKQDAAEVAQIGFDALMLGKDHVVAGFKNKVQAVAAKFMTDPMGARAQGSSTQPASGGKQ